MMDQSHAKAVQEKEAKKRIELKMLAARLGGQLAAIPTVSVSAVVINLKDPSRSDFQSTFLRCVGSLAARRRVADVAARCTITHARGSVVRAVKEPNRCWCANFASNGAGLRKRSQK